jgi:hypothetical protein
MKLNQQASMSSVLIIGLPSPVLTEPNTGRALIDANTVMRCGYYHHDYGWNEALDTAVLTTVGASTPR